MLLESNEPLVCICIPTYNAERTIQETLLSLLDQTYRNLIINVVDNASTDETLDLVRLFDDPRIIIHTHPDHVDGESNFTRAIALGLGDFTAIYHADDIYEPSMVAEQVEFLKRHPDVGGVLTEAVLMDECSNLTGQIKTPKDIQTPDHTYDFKQLFKAVLKHSNFMICPSAMVRTDIYRQEIKTWRGREFASSADLDVWLRIAKHQRIGILPKPLMRYRISKSQGSERVRRSVERADFFKVTDYYLQQDEEVKQFVTKKDKANYAGLERRNQMMRATNLFLQGHTQEAKALCKSAFSPAMLRAALKSKRGQLTLGLYMLLNTFILLKMNATGRHMLARLLTRIAR